MRIITGQAKGVRLKAPKGLNTRPTSDRVKESLFSILADRIYDRSILDLFAGTGNLGLEALSRGALNAIFVEHDSNCIKIIQENINNTKMQEKSKIIRGDVYRIVDNLNKCSHAFDIIFADPPYNKEHVNKLLNSLSVNILKPDSLIIIEHSKNEAYNIPQHIELIRKQQYGETIISIFRLTREE